MRRPIIGVMGPGDDATSADERHAYELGGLIAEKRWITLNGGRRSGVMAAVNRGARAKDGVTVGILPNDDRATWSEDLTIPIVTNMEQARNCINVLTADVIIAVGMNPGTASEVALAIKERKPVILLGGFPESPEFFRKLGDVWIAATPAEAAARAAELLPYARPEALVSTQWLAAHLTEPNVRVLDASYKQPGIVPTARQDYDAGHIPGAVFFDIDDVAMPNTEPLPHMIPSAERFAAKMAERGIGDDDRVIVYDTVGLSSAARAWWMLRLFGHDNVALLDGGLPKWRAEGRPLELANPAIPPRRFTARFDPAVVRGKEAVRANIAARREQVVDARSAGRFDGSAEETWPGRRRGHIPGSRNLPFDLITDRSTRQVKRAAELAHLFDEAGVDPGRPIVASCGSGVTACALAFALHLLGHPGAAIYDGSWAEWGLPGDTPVETGPAKP